MRVAISAPFQRPGTPPQGEKVPEILRSNLIRVTCAIFLSDKNRQTGLSRSPAIMPRNLFSVPIFFIVFRETFEAAIIVSVLLSIVEQIAHCDPSRFSPSVSVQNSGDDAGGDDNKHNTSQSSADDTVDTRAVIKKSRILVTFRLP